jgi:hypothetical protein
VDRLFHRAGVARRRRAGPPCRRESGGVVDRLCPGEQPVVLDVIKFKWEMVTTNGEVAGVGSCFSSWPLTGESAATTSSSGVEMRCGGRCRSRCR